MLRTRTVDKRPLTRWWHLHRFLPWNCTARCLESVKIEQYLYGNIRRRRSLRVRAQLMPFPVLGGSAGLMLIWTSPSPVFEFPNCLFSHVLTACTLTQREISLHFRNPVREKQKQKMPNKNFNMSDHSRLWNDQTFSRL